MASIMKVPASIGIANPMVAEAIRRIISGYIENMATETSPAQFAAARLKRYGWVNAAHTSVRTASPQTLLIALNRRNGDPMDRGDLLTQGPLQYLLLLLFVGSVYILVMITLFRRYRKNKREERERKAASLAGLPLPEPAPKQGFWQSLSFGNLLRGNNRDNSAGSANWTVPAELRNLPEPDLDMLLMPAHLDQSDYDKAPRRIGTAPLGVSAQTAKKGQGALGTASTNENDRNRDAVEVMRVSRHLDGGGLIVEMGGWRFDSAAEIQTEDQARRFTGLVKELALMTRGLSSEESDVAGTDSTDKPDDVASARIGMLRGQGQTEPPKLSFLPSLGRGGAAKADSQNSSAGIAPAVEEFLQFKLNKTPQFAERSIHIRSGPDHGIRIEVDGHYYDGIGDVVDPDVRDFLSALMREWEARH